MATIDTTPRKRSSAPLSERFRPASLDDVVGQPKAVALVRRFVDRGECGGRCFWVSGPTGTGKTTLARIIAASVADAWNVDEYAAARDLTADELRGIREKCSYYGLGHRDGRAVIVNEAHGLAAPMIERLLGILEPGNIPQHCTWVFTTTAEGEDKLFADQMDTTPLLSRCIRVALTNQGLARPFAERALTIARSEGLDGQPIEAYVKLAQKCKNSMRAMLQEIEAGVMIGGAA